MTTTITFSVDDDPYIDLTATQVIAGVSSAYNFAGKVVEVFLKAAPDTPDASALATLRSDGASPKITISTTTAVADLAGLIEVPGRLWMRARVYEGARKRTFIRAWLLIQSA